MDLTAGLIAFGIIMSEPNDLYNSITSPLIIAMLGAIYIVLKSLFVRRDPIPGQCIHRREYPLLFAEIDRAARALKVEPYEEVYLLEDINCIVGKRGRKELLFLGCHALEVLNRDELSSVLIHELAHVYHKDTKMSAKIHQSSKRWAAIGVAAAERGKLARWLLHNFAQYYVIKLNLHLRALSKEAEFLADYMAAKYGGNEVYASAMGKVSIFALFLGDPCSYLEIRDSPTPPLDYYNRLYDHFYRQLDENHGNWANLVLRETSDRYSTHPTLWERVQNIGLNRLPTLSFKKTDSSYRAEVKRLVEVTNLDWYYRAVNDWDQFCAGYHASKKIVSEYVDTTDISTKLDYAMALEDLECTDEALKIYNSILVTDYNPPAMYRKGMILLARNDSSGIDLLRSAMEADNSFIDSGLQVIGKYFHCHALREKQEALRVWAQRMMEISEQRHHEVNILYATDTFIPADMELNTMLSIKSILRSYREISRAYLVQKVLSFTDVPYYVIGVVLKPTCSKKRTTKVLDGIVSRVNQLDFAYFLLNMNEHTEFFRAFNRVQTARILR